MGVGEIHQNVLNNESVKPYSQESELVTRQITLKKEAPTLRQEKETESKQKNTKSLGTAAKFEYNKEINRIVITISENGTDEVLKEIPTKEIQNMLKRIHTMTGMVMDEEA